MSSIKKKNDSHRGCTWGIQGEFMTNVSILIFAIPINENEIEHKEKWGRKQGETGGGFPTPLARPGALKKTDRWHRSCSFIYRQVLRIKDMI